MDICKVFHLNPESLRYKWEALKYNSSELKFKEFDLENARNLRVSIKRELESKAEATAKLRLATSTSKARLNRPFGSTSFLSTPQRKEQISERKLATDFAGSPMKFESPAPQKPCEYVV